MGLGEIFLLYVCPALGGIMSTVMFAAPINDMRDALARGSLGDLSPFPFAMMTGNTIGWLIYGYFLMDPFIIASNLPGFVLSIWLNSGAAKLQYLDLKHNQTSSVAERNQVMHRWDADRSPEDGPNGEPRQRRRRQQQHQEAEEEDGLINDNQITERMQMTAQETLLLRVMIFWGCVLIFTTFLFPNGWGDPASVVGVVVNFQLVIFYAAPLKTISTVLTERNSASIHYETMVMNWINTSFWIGYGCARRDLVIIVPNATGLFLGIAQGVLCMVFPRQPLVNGTSRLSLHELEADLMLDPDDSNPEGEIPPAARVAAGGKNSAVPDTPEVI